jgi:hypothetical protein
MISNQADIESKEIREAGPQVKQINEVLQSMLNKDCDQIDLLGAESTENSGYHQRLHFISLLGYEPECLFTSCWADIVRDRERTASLDPCIPIFAA